MNFLSSVTRRRAVGLAGACALALSGIAGAALAGAGSADAATCTAGGGPCVIAGSADLGAGTLSAILPATLTWSAGLSGANQNVVDAVPADQIYTVDDATGTGAGWHVTLAATTFTCTAASTPTPCTTTQSLAATGTFSTTGSVASATATTAPSQACTFVTTPADCTVPTNAITYPVPITTAATIGATTPVSIYNAAAGTGTGSVNIGGSTAANPVGWWIHVPGTAVPGSYTSTINVNVVSAP